MNQILANMLAILCANYYSDQSIFSAFQNDIVMPQNGQFIIITELPTSSISYPLYSFTGSLPSGTTTHSNINITRFQFDFYGTNARLCCVNTRTYMQSQDATNWLQAQSPELSVFNIDEMVQLTANLDQDRYLQRFAFKFSLFNNNTIDYSNYAFNTVNPNIILSSPQVLKE